MKALIQRASRAEVSAGGESVSRIGRGLLVLVGVMKGDETGDATALARKVANLRIFESSEGKMDLSVKDIAGEVLAVSQFTLGADTRKGNRPSFTGAEEPERARELYEEFMRMLKAEGIEVKPGRFGAHMEVTLTNDGPVTIILDTK